jgi:predicted RNA-binding protein
MALATVDGIWNQPFLSEETDMCNESAFVLFFKDGHLHLDDIDLIEVEEDSLRLKDMSGNEKIIPGRIRTVDLVNRRIETAE